MIINFRKMKAEKILWGTNGQKLLKFDDLDFYDSKVQHTLCQRRNPHQTQCSSVVNMKMRTLSRKRSSMCFQKLSGEVSLLSSAPGAHRAVTCQDSCTDKTVPHMWRKTPSSSPDTLD